MFIKESNTNLQTLLHKSKAILQNFLQRGITTMLVGGAVRDCLLADTNNIILSVADLDIDIVVNVPPWEAMQVLQSNNFRVIETGLDFGSFTAIDKRGHAFEVTSLRKDVECYGRRAKVILGGTLEDDSWRRDFSINALYLDIQGEIHDFHKGIEDLHNNIVRFIGDARTRIKEDYLRILRFFRFSSRFAKEFDREAMAAIKESNQGIALLSKERITKEMYSILQTSRMMPTLQVMQELGTLTAILGPDFKLKFQYLSRIEPITSRAIAIKVDHHCIPMLALSFDSGNSPNIVQKLTLNKNHRRMLQSGSKMLTIARYQERKLMLNALLPPDRSIAITALCFNENISLPELCNMISSTSALPINGNDILHHFPAIKHRQIHQMLCLAYDLWIECNFQIDKTAILEKIAQHAQALKAEGK